MPVFANVTGVWKEITTPSFKNGSVWTDLTLIDVKVSGVWTNVWSASFGSRSFYIVPNGATASMINKAFDSTADWLTIVFGPGLWFLEDSIRITRSRVTIQGVPSGTFLYNRAVLGGNGLITSFGSSTNRLSDILIENLTVDGSPTAGSTCSGILLKETEKSAITNCTVQNCPNYGIFVSTNSVYNVIRGNLIKGNLSYGVTFNIGCSANSFIDNTVTNNGGVGVLLTADSNDNSIVANKIQNGTTHGIAIQGTSHRTMISSNVISNNGNHGVSISAVDDSSINGNTIQNNFSYGLNITGGAARTLATGNIITNNQEGIDITASTKSNITGNQVYDNFGYGMYIGSGAIRSLVINNVCIGSQNNFTNGSSSTVQSNNITG